MYLNQFLSHILPTILYCSTISALSIPAHTLAIRTSNSSAQPLPPKQDPWYTAPSGYETTSPGTILRIRPGPGNITSVIGNCSAAYNVLFRTTNSNHQPAFAVTTVFLPLSASTNTSDWSALLSYQIPYNTADLDGSPSYLLYGGGFPDIPTALGDGWVVSVPDFEGPLASFLLGLTEGYAVLDSIRSVFSQSSTFGLSGNSTKTALWGYSGGSFATMFAIELQAQYAPELVLHGAAIGGTLPSIPASIPLINGGQYAGLLPAAFLGITSQSSAAREILTSNLNPNNASEFMAALDYPYTDLASHFGGQDIMQEYFTNYSAFWYAPEIQGIQKNNCHLGYQGVPQMPMFMYKAFGDELAPIEEVDDLVERWCSLGGVDMLYVRNRYGNHIAEYLNGAPAARQFLISVLSGVGDVVPVGGGCVTRDVYVDLTGSW